MIRTILLFAIASLFILSGCCGTVPVVVAESPVEVEVVEPVVEVPEVPEVVVVEEVIVEPDYASMTPAELGIYDVFFAVDCYALSDRAKADLDVSSGVMNKFSDSQFVIEGYCDERGSAEYNLALCKNRISAVRDYLISLGVDSSQLKTKSYGEENPFADDSDESAWSLNRRVHFARP